MLNNVKADKKVNALKDECLCPLFKAYEELDSLDVDEVLEVITDDISSATNSIPKFCNNHQCPVSISEEGDGLWKILIKKDRNLVKVKEEKTKPLLRLEQISKKFTTNKGINTALEPIDLSIKRGEFVCVVGPSGCGKSTLLNIIAGLTDPDEGALSLNEIPVKGPASDRVVIFQDLALFPWLNIINNVEFGLKMKGLSNQDRRSKARELLKLVHLSKFENHYIHELSGGMRQRVALARALAIDPEVLLMDEPFSALDAHTRHLLHLELQELWLATRKTIIFITHNVREAVSLADRVLVMTANPGRIKKEFIVDIQRPRENNDKKVNYIVDEIMIELKSEIEKVARKEYENA